LYGADLIASAPATRLPTGAAPINASVKAHQPSPLVFIDYGLEDGVPEAITCSWRSTTSIRSIDSQNVWEMQMRSTRTKRQRRNGHSLSKPDNRFAHRQSNGTEKCAHSRRSSQESKS